MGSRSPRERCRRCNTGTLVLAALVLVLGGVPALAAVEGSPHDLIAQGYDVQKNSLLQERCTRCHLTTSPANQRLVPTVPPVLEAVYDASSLVCFSCHDGTTIVSPNVDASRTAFHPASHGNNLSGYEGLSGDEVERLNLSGARMTCVTCHEPHDAGHRPFLRADPQKLCLLCHSTYAEYGRGKENRSGSHLLAPDPLGVPREEVPLNMGEAFRTGFPSPYPPRDGKAAGGWHWDLGGHLDQGDVGAMGCFTCHAVHGDEAAVPTSKLLTVAPVNDVANRFCEGCHAGTRGDGATGPPHPNPGGTTTGRTYHAVDDDEANGPGRLLEIREPPDWPFGGGSPRRLLCTTCHTAHGAWIETPLLRTPVTEAGFCEECHDQAPACHHPVGERPETGCFSQLPGPTYGTERGLYCASCHQAHNAGRGAKREADYVPLLIDAARTGELCSRCHPPANPTCSKNKDYQASHFIGDPLEIYGDTAPPLREDPWPESNLSSYYADPEARVVTCFSCHAFREGAQLSGDGGTSHLLARSGNSVEWNEGQESTYLCTGCHSVNPKSGEVKSHSHPMMEADAAKLDRAAPLPVTMTPGGKVNCDSCHRPHEAITRGGYYILEHIEGLNTDPEALHPTIDFTSFCHLCHSSGKY